MVPRDRSNDGAVRRATKGRRRDCRCQFQLIAERARVFSTWRPEEGELCGMMITHPSYHRAQALAPTENRNTL